jgi:hypothetical protein
VKASILLMLLFVASIKADEPTPEVKVIIARFQDEVKSESERSRVSAYTTVGELGEKGKSIRRQLCQGMLDKSTAVKTAAADALKKVDATIYKMALAIEINQDEKTIDSARDMKQEAEPLTPLLLKLAVQNATLGSQVEPIVSSDLTREAGVAIRLARQKMIRCINALSQMAPDDSGVNKAIIQMLSNPIEELRTTALDNIDPLKNKKLALSKVVFIANDHKNGVSLRAKAVTKVPDLIDNNTSTNAKKALEKLRFDAQPEVRAAVEDALKRIK